MLSKPDFTGFFNKRLVASSGIAIVVLFIFLKFRIESID
jgi:hypothetical protein